MPVSRVEAEQAILLVVDIQEKLLPHIHGGDRVTEQAAKLIRGCHALDVPVLATEQYPEGLGSTVEPIREALPERTPIEDKLRFSACVEPIRERLAEQGRPVVLIAGIESHVCVLQTALDLLQAGYRPGVVGDAVGSRRSEDHDLAMRRLTAAGVLPLSVEMALMEMVRKAGTEAFKAILSAIK